MLFGAVASLADKNTFIPLWLIMGLGLITSVGWLYLNWRTDLASEEALARLKLIDSRLEEIFTVLRQNNKLYRFSGISISRLMVWFFPLATGLTWLIMLILYFRT